MFDPITSHDFNQLLHMAVDTYQLDPTKTYVEFTWWDHVYRPLIDTTVDRGKSQFILVFGECLCNTYRKDSHGNSIPTAFWIWNDAVDFNNTTHRPMTVGSLMDNEWMLDFTTVKFLFSNSPINYFVDINPFETAVYKNALDETVLALYAENRDSGEWQPFRCLQPKNIKFVDDKFKSPRNCDIMQP